MFEHLIAQCFNIYINSDTYTHTESLFLSLKKKSTLHRFVVPTKDLKTPLYKTQWKNQTLFHISRENALCLPLKCFSLAHTHTQTHCRADSRGTAHLCEASWLWRPWEPSTCPLLSAIEKRRPAFTLHTAQSQAWQTLSVWNTATQGPRPYPHSNKQTYAGHFYLSVRVRTLPTHFFFSEMNPECRFP